MSHPPTMSSRQFSPQQHSPTSPYQLPPNKRAKFSPDPSSNPGSPSYSNYAPSPGATTPAPTPNTLASPVPQNHVNNQVHSGNYNTPYQQPNGRATSVGMALTLPPSNISTTPIPSPQIPTPNTSHAPYSTARLAPIPPPTTSISPSAPPIITNMGPPAFNPATSFSNDVNKQGQKPTAKTDVAYDVNDMLMGTGIDLDEEAEYLNNLDSRGYPNYPPGGRDTLYGAGLINQPAEHTDARTQEELAVESADRAWNEAAARLARSRNQEVANFLLEPGTLHRRIQDVAQKYGLGLNLGTKPDGKSYLGRPANPAEFPKPEIKVVIQKTPDGAIVETLGSFLPNDTYLVDQVALLSIGTKQRLRELLNDANKVSKTRQKTAHGLIPDEWANAAAPKPPAANGIQGEGSRTGAESAVSPRTNPLKRSADEISNGLPTPVSDVSSSNVMVDVMAASAKDARNAEEARLRKRLKRQEKAAEKDNPSADGSSRAGSAAPGTPGSIAPDGGEVKAPTKKESKKAAKLAEASSTTVNQTLGLFAGGKKKKYSWLTGAASSGASTPRPQATGAPGTPGSTAGSGAKTTQGPLTKAGVTQLGQFREDSDKGKNIQLRDWVVVLEERGFDQMTLEHIYEILDKSARATVESTS